MALRLHNARPMAKRTAAKTYEQGAGRGGNTYAESEVCGATQTCLLTGRNQRVRTTFVFHADRAVKHRSWSLTARIDVPDGGAEGPIAVIGGETAGWSLYLGSGIPTFCYRLAGTERRYVRASQPIGKGRHAVRFEIAGGTARLFVDDSKVAEAEIPAFVYGFDETFDIGRDRGASFSGTILEVAVDSY
jgi:hypothetical protein